MLSFIARNGGVGVRGAEHGGGCCLGCQYIHPDGGPAAPPRPPRPCAVGKTHPWARGAEGAGCAGSGDVTTGRAWTGPGQLLRERGGWGGSRKPVAKYCT